MSSIQGSPDFQPIDSTRLQETSTDTSSKTAGSIPLPKTPGLQSESPLANAAQFVASPSKAVSETASSMEKIFQEATPTAKKSLGRTIGSHLVTMQKTIGKATPESNVALVKAGRIAAVAGGAILYGAGVVAGGAVTLALSTAAGLVGIGLSIASTTLVAGYHILNPERSMRAFVNDSKEGINLAFQASGALRGAVRDTLFPIAQCIPLATAALGAGLLEFGLGKNVDPHPLAKGMALANRDLAAYIQKHFSVTTSNASKTGSVSDKSDSSEESTPSEATSRSSRSRSGSDLPEMDTRGRSPSGFPTSSDES